MVSSSVINLAMRATPRSPFGEGGGCVELVAQVVLLLASVEE